MMLYKNVIIFCLYSPVTICRYCKFNPLNANPEKWSNTFVFDHFMNLALKGLIKCNSASLIKCF